MSNQSIPDFLEVKRLNELPGLSALPDEATALGYKKANDYVPRRDPEYIFRVDDVRVVYGHLNADTPEGLMLSGPRGSGKSSVIHQLHAYLNRPLFYVTGHHSLEFEDILGTKEIVDGDTITLDGPLVQAAEMPYATFLFEEWDRARTQVSVSMNPILDGYDIIHTLDSGRRIRPSAGFRVFATANTNGPGDMTGDYNSAQTMDTSLLDRVLCHHVWYANPDDEFAVLRGKVPAQIGDEEIRKSISFANDVRYLYTNREADASPAAQSLGVGATIHTTISTRALSMLWATLCRFPNMPNPIVYALKLVVTNKCTPECAEAIHRLAEAQFAGDQ